MNIDIIDIIHFTHTDFGFTDHQVVCGEMRKRYIDEVVEIANLNYKLPPEEHFYWTCEGTLPVLDWWNSTSRKKQEIFIKLVKDGFIEVGALPFNTTPFPSAKEWDKLLNWLPSDLWSEIKPKVVIQNDINGFSRAGAIKAYKKGIKYLWMGINTDNGGSPFPQPTPFRWKLSGNKELFCYSSVTYPWGYFFFHKDEWRKGPLPKVYDTAYRRPEPLDIFKTDKDFLEQAHKICTDVINGKGMIYNTRVMENQKYPYKRLIIPFTNMWRMDNDPAVPWIGKFVSEWNKMGFKPKLRLTTPSKALKSLEEEKEEKFPVYDGEWTDWWANGTASTPRELSVSRKARQTLITIENSPIFRISKKDKIDLNDCWKDICLFYEHTWGAGESVADPYSTSSIGQHIEKYLLAYRPYEMSKLLLADKIRDGLANEGSGVYVINPTNCEYTGWIYLKENCIRGDYDGLENSKTKEKIKFIKDKGETQFLKPTPKELSKQNTSKMFADLKEGKVVKFWIESLKPGEILKFNLIKINSKINSLIKNIIEIKEDLNKWPISVKWEGMKKPLYQGDIGKLITLDINYFTPRWKYKEIFAIEDKTERLEQIRKHFKLTECIANVNAKITENDSTIIYEQYLAHPRMKWIYRRIELFKNIPRVLLKVRFYRKSAPPKAEIFYIKFQFPFKNKKIVPVTSCGGVPFKPGIDQLPNTCKDYFAIDGWVKYGTEYGNWLWFGKDSALVTFGQPNDAMKLEKLTGNTDILLSIVYNNVWYTNFAGDENGIFEFNYEIIWRKSMNNKKVEDNFFPVEPVVYIK